jgi:predicted NBD/HSP70 family sugar kinase
MIGYKPLLGGVELGGTKCVCVIGTGPGDIRAQTSIPTGSDPAVTLRRIDKTLNDWQEAHGVIKALGIASFGPINLSRGSPTEMAGDIDRYIVAPGLGPLSGPLGSLALAADAHAAAASASASASATG